MIDGKTAVVKAKLYLADLMADEKLSNIGLEELELNRSTNAWNVTLGFTRPWNNAFAGLAPTPRSFRVLSVNADTGDILGMTMREGQKL